MKTERNPHKPRLWLDDEKHRSAENTMSKPLTGMTSSEQAEMLCADRQVREELLASLHGRKSSQ